MKLKLIYFFAVVCLIIFTVCTKYPDGGWSTRAVKHLADGRLSDGKTWSVSKYVVNGIDSTKEVTGLSPNSYTVGSATFLRDFFDKTKQVCRTKQYIYNTELTNNKSTLTFSRDVNMCSSYLCEYDIFNPLKTISGNTVWKIRKLTKDELVLIYLNQSIFELTLTSEE